MSRWVHAVALALAAPLAAAPFAACVIAQDLGSTGLIDGGADAPGGSSNDGDGSSPSGDGSVLLDARVDGRLDGAGPGASNVLPSGYCCTSDEQCRMRHCLDSPSGRMCFDECSADTQWYCDRPLSDFRCDLAQATFDQVCIPQAGETFACLDPSGFTRGTKTTGECCAQREDGLLGQECASNLCMTKNGGPFFCTQVCEAGVDCPAGFSCLEQLFYSLCVPNGTYDCK